MNSKIIERCVKVSRSLIHLPVSTKKHFSFLIYRKKLIVGFGYNNGWKSDPLAKKYACRFSAKHSELAAIKALSLFPANLPQCYMINVRVRRKDNSLGNSKPCPSCQEMLGEFGIPIVYYYDEEDGWQYMKI